MAHTGMCGFFFGATGRHDHYISEYAVYYKSAEADEPQVNTVTIAQVDAVFTPPVATTGE